MSLGAAEAACHGDEGVLEHPAVTGEVPESSLHPSIPCQ